MVDVAQRLANLSPSQRKLLESRLKEKPQVSQPIAVVGMACRLPGAPDLNSFWDLIANRKSGICEVPPDRWDADELYDSDPDTPGKMPTKWGGFLDDVGDFDSIFFGIAPREASRMDPQQRLLLEVTWEALENAQLAPDRISGKPTGVFVGIGGTDYSKIPTQFDDYLGYIDPHIGTGNALSIAANRISYIMDFRGPSIAVDTACSSGLVALHLAIQSLRNQECDAVVAGAVNLILSPEVTIAFSKARMLSPTGQCRPFDADANGYVRGEGCGVLVLKRLTDATRAGDPILAVIRGSAVNQDGRTSGITAPNALSQVSCIRSALAAAGLSQSDISYIEAHGTGTPLGDPIEFQALSTIFPRSQDSEQSCYVSSVKANIGHTETVSGIAGLIKVILMMQRGVIVPQSCLENLNPNIDLNGTRLQIPSETVPWPSNGQRIAGVSSFGFGGTNAHVIVEAVHAPADDRESEATGAPLERPFHVLTVSAKSKKSLTKLAGGYAAALHELSDDQVADFCFSANTGRAHFNHRLAAIAGDREQLIGQLGAVEAGKRAAGSKLGEVRVAVKPKVGFLFTGQGSQYPQMARALYEHHPLFRREMDRCDEILRDHHEHALLSVIYPEDDGLALLNQTEYTQPALFAIEYALAALWRSWGVEPNVMMGHSVGEYVAACLAGVFSLEDGLRLIAMRAQLMQQLPNDGLMAVIFARRDQVVETIAAYGDQISIATANGPENNVISGKAEIVEKVVAEFAKVGIGTQRLTVSHAFHSPLMDPILDEFEAFAATLHYDRPRIPVVSNRTGELVETAEFDCAYWRDHLRNCVEFAHGMDVIADQQLHALVEIGPTTSLLGMGRRCRPDLDVAWIPSLRKGRDDWQTLFTALAELYVLGWKVDWVEFDQRWKRRHVPLPNYPFERSLCWFDPKYTSRTGFGAARGPSLHPLLGAKVMTALEPVLFETRFATDSPKYLRDHQVEGSIVVPAAAFVEQGLGAARVLFGDGDHGVERISIQQAMFLPVEGHRVVQVSTAPESGGRSTFETHSLPGDNDELNARWSLHASGQIVHADSLDDSSVRDKIDLDEARSRVIKRQSREEFYELVAARELVYGPMFQVLGEIMRSDIDTVAEVQLPEAVAKELDKYQLHPSLGDACLQSIAGAVPLEENGDYTPYTYIPVSIRLVRKRRPLTEKMFCYAVRTSDNHDPSPEVVEADVFLTDEAGNVLVELLGSTVQRVGRPHQDGQTQDIYQWLYRVDWQEADSLQPDESIPWQGDYLVLVDEAGFGNTLAERIRAGGGGCATVRVGDGFSVIDAEQRDYSVRPTAGEDFAQVLKQAFGDADATCQGIVHCWSCDVPAADDEAADTWNRVRDLGCASALRLIQQVARHPFTQPPPVWLVTSGAQQVVADAAQVKLQQSPLWGLGRTAALEHPELKCRLVDVCPDADQAVQVDSLAAELQSAADERQIAYRGTRRFVARLARAPESIPSEIEGDATAVCAKGPFRLRITDTGSFDSLKYESCKRGDPGEGQVEIEIAATGLNFSDVLKAMGLYPGITDVVVPVGIECSGVVANVGPGVDRFQIGDAVMGVAPYSFASHTQTAEYALVKKPDNIDHDEASTIPITFLTAYYGLCRLAQLQPGERVLIHAGAGGVGLAAIQIAQHIGAEIFATAGSDEKRDYLRSLGVPHVMNSRTLGFGDEIRAVTGREAIDVVLNSLPGDAISTSLSLLRAYGRFLEIGKTDIYQNSKIGLSPFQDNLSYFAIDLDRMLRQRPDFIRGLFEEVMQYFAAGTYRPLPFTRFSIEETVDAFRYMAQRKNIGKVVVSFEDLPQAANDVHKDIELARADGTYLITGGLGALGLQVASWLADHGAGHLALMSRRGPQGVAADAIAALNSRGVKTIAIQGDVVDRTALDQAIGQIPADFAPLRGVFHAAGVLEDGVMFDMDVEQLEKPMRPKVQGAWNLHAATLDQPLDHFVLFSSIASVLGSPGQSNYAAGNAYLDSLAAFRRSIGKPAVSINWGPWADSGMAAQAGRDQQLASRGMSSLPSHRAFEVLDGILTKNPVQTAVMSVRWADMLRAGAGTVPPLLLDIAESLQQQDGSDDDAEDQAFRASLLQCDVDQRKERLSAYFGEQLAHIMGLEPDDIDVTQPLTTMGLDSLMAIELKNKIEKRLRITLPMAVFMQEPSVSTLATHVAGAIGCDAEEELPSAEATVPDNGQPVSQETDAGDSN